MKKRDILVGKGVPLPHRYAIQVCNEQGEGVINVSKPYEMVNVMINVLKEQVNNLDIEFTEFTNESGVGKARSQIHDIIDTIQIIYSAFQKHLVDREDRIMQEFIDKKLKESKKE